MQRQTDRSLVIGERNIERGRNVFTWPSSLDVCCAVEYEFRRDLGHSLTFVGTVVVVVGGGGGVVVVVVVAEFEHDER